MRGTYVSTTQSYVRAAPLIRSRVDAFLQRDCASLRSTRYVRCTFSTCEASTSTVAAGSARSCRARRRGSAAAWSRAQPLRPRGRDAGLDRARARGHARGRAKPRSLRGPAAARPPGPAGRARAAGALVARALRELRPGQPAPGVARAPTRPWRFTARRAPGASSSASTERVQRPLRVADGQALPAPAHARRARPAPRRPPHLHHGHRPFGGGGRPRVDGEDAARRHERPSHQLRPRRSGGLASAWSGRSARRGDETGKECRVLMDLAGPKIRTGPDRGRAAHRDVEAHEGRDRQGDRARPRRRPPRTRARRRGGRRPLSCSSATKTSRRVRRGDVLRFRDARGKRRALEVRERGPRRARRLGATDARTSRRSARADRSRGAKGAPG